MIEEHLPDRRAYRIEIVLVFAVTLGLSGLRSLVRLADSLLQPKPLDQQSVAINVPQARFDLLDLVAQLLGVVQLAAWGGLGLYLLWRGGTRLRALGLDRSRIGPDALGSLGLAAVIGIPGLALYFAAWKLGLNLAVQPSTLDESWWRSVTLVLAAFGNAWAEEVLVVGYLLTRLKQLGWRDGTALLASSVLRGSYHLYQGFGGFIGNVVMGLVFGKVFQRTNRLWILIVAHTLLDVVAFLGYTLLRGKVSWLP
ncbi:type II CAAX endopeptidase family protein [Actinosynnema sp. NPDC047251]|uniref:CAAX amino terminal protease family n=1 Tax=Saccharothrix espanaensis (strain ATCC 51144 / DSM 44229 / JCM 9112 / NBRC 15066 / NRRL 15764) TaxID=1179773 RepID=K0JPS8_SACES|nr:type II CAAX endopeptidase family protein [Saccharothrix espanaensis]CCH27446.1 CAAX amino terminal protease family [Saccharothrix espanaensis DSM 44229]